MLVTLRARREVESLRRRALYDKVAAAIGHVRRPDFRAVHYTVQTDHVHLIVEASSTRALSSGMRGFAIRVARAINRALGRRGAVWSDRCHARALSTPRMVRSAWIYVLANARKQLRAVAGIDPCSSAPWFDGYRDQLPRPGVPPPTLPPQTWLLRVGWRRHGLISLEEGPCRGPTRSSGGSRSGSTRRVGVSSSPAGLKLTHPPASCPSTAPATRNSPPL